MNPKDTLAALVRGQRLDQDSATQIMSDVLDGLWSAAQMGALLAALAARGESADELAGFALALRARAVPLPGGPRRGAIDTCGTGGSGLATTNTSTAAAFVLAAGGVPVAKHGNRASSGLCGSADVLEELGATVDLEPPAAASLLDDLGLTFLFAPRFHPVLRQLGPVRRELGFRTTFNLLGPLCNPALVGRQVLGVSDPERAGRLAQALLRLGAERALVVSGDDGLDEISLCGPTLAWELRDGTVREIRLFPNDLGLSTVSFDQIAGGDRAANAAHLRAVLAGHERGPRAEHTALNAGAGFWVAGRAASLRDGISLARDILRDGAAIELLSHYIAASNRLRGAA